MPSTRELPEAVRKYIKAHDGMLLANHTARSRSAPISTARTTRWKRSSTSRTSAWSRECSARENLLSREERWIGCRGCAGHAGIKSPAPICADPADSGIATGDASCQVVQAPAGEGSRLVADPLTLARIQGRRTTARQARDGEIRLTYRELSALIERSDSGAYVRDSKVLNAKCKLTFGIQQSAFEGDGNG